MLECKSCIWKDNTDISEMMIWLFLDRQWAKGYSDFWKISPHFIFKTIGKNDWAAMHSPVAKGLTGIKTAGIIPPTQPLAILAVIGLCCCPSWLFSNSP